MANDLWRTPTSIIEYVENRWGDIEIDLCASKENSVSESYYSEESSMLDISSESPRLNAMCRSNILWCNPPYSNPLPFVKKCKEIASDDRTIIMILNFDPSTKWFAVINEHAKGIHPIVGGRVSFVDGEGNKIKGNNKPQVMVRFGGYGLQQWETIHITDIQPQENKK